MLVCQLTIIQKPCLCLPLNERKESRRDLDSYLTTQGHTIKLPNQSAQKLSSEFDRERCCTAHDHMEAAQVGVFHYQMLRYCSSSWMSQY